MIHRIKRGKGFCYRSDDGSDPGDERLREVRSLGIPPAWTGVTIDPDPAARIQATGFDKKGRKQYIYHPAVTERNNRRKFSKLKKFIRVLPAIRSEVNRLLRQSKWSREKVTGLAIATIDELCIRVGNECYRKANGSYGLTTLEKKHLIRKKGVFHLQFRGKSGKEHCLPLSQTLGRMLHRLSKLPGEKLFSYRSGEGMVKALTSGDINNFLKEVAGEPVSAKDFRTWKGTVAALAETELAVEEINQTNRRKKLLTLVVRKVSGFLGNTLAICRDYYIHPKIIKMLEEQSLPARLRKLSSSCTRVPACYSFHEYLAARLLYGGLN